MKYTQRFVIFLGGEGGKERKQGLFYLVIPDMIYHACSIQHSCLSRVQVGRLQQTTLCGADGGGTT